MVASVTDSFVCAYVPAAHTTSFTVPDPDVFDASFSFEVGLNDFQDSPGQFDFLSLTTSEPAYLDFDSTFDIDIPVWNEAAFGESLSQESTPSTSSWDVTSGEGPSTETGTGTGIDMELQFPSVCVDAIGDGTGMPTDEEFLRVIIEAAQSRSPKTVGLISCVVVASICALIQLIFRVDSIRFGSVGTSRLRRIGLSHGGTLVILTCELGLRGYVLSFVFGSFLC